MPGTQGYLVRYAGYKYLVRYYTGNCTNVVIICLRDQTVYFYLNLPKSSLRRAYTVVPFQRRLYHTY